MAVGREKKSSKGKKLATTPGREGRKLTTIKGDQKQTF